MSAKIIKELGQNADGFPKVYLLRENKRKTIQDLIDSWEFNPEVKYSGYGIEIYENTETCHQLLIDLDRKIARIKTL